MLTFLPTYSLCNRLLKSPWYIAYIISTILVTLTLGIIKLWILYLFSYWPVSYREFWNQSLWHHLAADFTIVMSRTLKVTHNHVTYDRGALFLRAIMSSSCFVLLTISEEAKTWLLFFSLMYNKTIMLDSVFVISRIIKVFRVFVNIWNSRRVV